MEAWLYEKLKDQKVCCNLCRHRCVIAEGGRGRCHVRENRQGILETLVYGRLVARHIDPIEKKPLFHVAPGSLSYSVATAGCNFRCLFCQNAEIAQMPADRNGLILGEYHSPESVVQDAVHGGCKSIAYTYTEPTVFFEFACDTAQIAHKNGLINVFVTNGYMTAEALDRIHPYLDAANVDLKGFTDNFYKQYCGAHLEPVKDSLRHMKSMGVFVEITTLLIPGLNDNPRELENLARFIVDDLGPDTPWHISRFHPAYQLLDRGATPVKALAAAREIGMKSGLRYVYTGNVPGDAGEKTSCWNCGALLIDRRGYSIRENRLEKGSCPSCGIAMVGIGL